MSEFTKGEWSVKYSNGEAAVYYPHGFFTSANIIKIDETRLDGESWLSMRERTKGDREKSRVESNANMSLIASSPDMYNLLDILSTDLQVMLGERAGLMVKDINNLLAKARGET